MDKESERWNYKPTGKVQLNPLFSRSISIRAIFEWYASYWFQLSTTTLALILALLAWVFFFPSISSFQKLNWQSYGTLTFLIWSLIAFLLVVSIIGFTDIKDRLKNLNLMHVIRRGIMEFTLLGIKSKIICFGLSAVVLQSGHYFRQQFCGRWQMVLRHF